MWFKRNETPNNAALWSVTFASKSLTGMETCYGNIKKEALGILHGLEKFHHSCFSHEVKVITDHKPLIAIFKKVVVSLSHRFKRKYHHKSIGIT